MSGTPACFNEMRVTGANHFGIGTSLPYHFICCHRGIGRLAAGLVKRHRINQRMDPHAARRHNDTVPLIRGDMGRDQRCGRLAVMVKRRLNVRKTNAGNIFVAVHRALFRVRDQYTLRRASGCFGSGAYQGICQPVPRTAPGSSALSFAAFRSVCRFRFPRVCRLAFASIRVREPEQYRPKIGVLNRCPKVRLKTCGQSSCGQYHLRTTCPQGHRLYSLCV